MNSSYKIALISAAVICIVVISYYVFMNTNNTDQPGGNDVALVTPPDTDEPDTREPSLVPPVTPPPSTRDRTETTRPVNPPADTTARRRNLLDDVNATRDTALTPPSRPPTTGPSTTDSPRREDNLARRDHTAPDTPVSSEPRTLTFGPSPDDSPADPPQSDRDILSRTPTTPPTVTPPITPQPPARTETTAPERTETTTPDRTETTAREPARETRTESRPSQPQTHTIREGETLSSIAADLSRQYGSRVTWIDIAQANPRVDPNRIRPGQVINLPPRDAVTTRSTTTEAGTNAQGFPMHTVRASETLSSIAQQHYGDERLWTVIYEANQPTIGIDPNRLREGMRLAIPPAPRGAR